MPWLITASVLCVNVHVNVNVNVIVIVTLIVIVFVLLLNRIQLSTSDYQCPWRGK